MRIFKSAKTANESSIILWNFSNKMLNPVSLCVQINYLHEKISFGFFSLHVHYIKWTFFSRTLRATFTYCSLHLLTQNNLVNNTNMWTSYLSPPWLTYCLLSILVFVRSCLALFPLQRAEKVQTAAELQPPPRIREGLQQCSHPRIHDARAQEKVS